MKTVPALRYGLLAVIGCLVLAALFARSASVDPRVHNDYAGRLQNARAMDMRISHDVLRLRSGLIGHYDALVDALEQLELSREQLGDIPDFLDAEGAAAIEEARTAYVVEAERKAALVERFKSTNAALRGSLRYFPLVARQLLEASASTPAHPAERLRDALLQYEVSRDPADRRAAMSAADALERVVLAGVGPDVALAETMLLHARNLLLRRVQLDELIQRIDSAPTAEVLAQLQARYEEGYARAHHRAEQGRWLLFLLGAIALAGILKTLSALAAAKSQLEVANDQLERRVRERTAELSEAKAHLESDALELNALNEELEASNRELDDFAYIASHDLKEPLRGIKNYAAFLLEDYEEQLDAEGREKLSTLVRLGSRMDELIDNLLNFSRVGRTELAVGETCIEEVVEEVVDSLHISLEERGVEVRIPEPLPTIHCDRVRVTEVFRNLIGNALKYNDKADKWIEIGVIRDTSQSGPEKPHFTFYVKDNGIGIREKHVDSVFRLFKRLHGRDKYGGGTGAGLTIVKKIVERHGGRIWLESVHGEGTTFFIDFGGHEHG